MSALGEIRRRSASSAASARVEQVTNAFKSLAVKAASIEAKVTSLSGGNQQKVVLARALLSEPETDRRRRADAGRRRRRARRDLPDPARDHELGHAGRRQFLRRGGARGALRQGHRAVARTGRRDADRRRCRRSQDRRGGGQRSASCRCAGASQARGRGAPSGWRHFLQMDNAPAVPLAIVTVLLALYGYSQNPNFLSSFNIYNMLMLATALGFIALGQTIALLLGGVDLSVGPLAGFLVVVASFFVNDGQPSDDDRGGLLLMFVGASSSARSTVRSSASPISRPSPRPWRCTSASRDAASFCATGRADTSTRGVGGHHVPDRADPRGLHRAGAVRRSRRVRPAQDARGLAASRGRFGRGIGAPDRPADRPHRHRSATSARRSSPRWAR